MGARALTVQQILRFAILQGCFLTPLALSFKPDAFGPPSSRPLRLRRTAAVQEASPPRSASRKYSRRAEAAEAVTQPSIRIVIKPKQASPPQGDIVGVISPTDIPKAPAEESGRADYPEYWYDPRIHNFGNIGMGGRVHAAFAPVFTWLIDKLSYGGVDVRQKVLETLPTDASVLDLCCGTGFSTARNAHGVDTSAEMLGMARLFRPDATFTVGNAETYGKESEYDIVSVMFATHEMPKEGRRRVLRNALRVARSEVIVCDIDPNFEETLKAKPLEGASFLSGEPYVLDYLANSASALAPPRSRSAARPSKHHQNTLRLLALPLS
jgi:SAM-dependent methyltransferase